MADLFRNRSDESSKPIDGEHPDRSLSGKHKISPEQGTQSGKYNFHAPAGQSAYEKILPVHH